MSKAQRLLSISPLENSQHRYTCRWQWRKGIAGKNMKSPLHLKEEKALKIDLDPLANATREDMQGQLDKQVDHFGLVEILPN